MTKAHGKALTGGVIGVLAIYIAAHGALSVAAPLFLVAMMFARTARRDSYRSKA